jgi:predicted RNA-binding Zn-ribbon protein involved in translation (DUF1610 family)
MTNPITTLTCPSCGSKLQITKGFDRFACFYCGNEHIVHREGGAVYLEPIAIDIHHIRGGVDKTAAELAIARLTKELSDLDGQLKSATTRNLYSWKPRTDLETILAVLSVVLFIVGGNSGSVVVWLIFLCCFGPFFYLWFNRDAAARKMKQESIKDIQVNINDTKAALARNRKLV